jgi:hypothetical protein
MHRKKWIGQNKPRAGQRYGWPKIQSIVLKCNRPRLFLAEKDADGHSRELKLLS